MIRQVFWALAAVMLLAACGGDQAKDISYLMERQRGLVLLDMDFKGMVRPEFKFRRFDPATGQLLDGSVKVEAPSGSVKSGPYGRMPTGQFTLEMEFEPGHWFLHEIESYSIQGFNKRTITYEVYSAGSLGFEVRPGQPIYIGAYQMAQSLSVAASDGLPAQLTGRYLLTQSDIQPVQPYAVTFGCEREMSIVGRPNCALDKVSRLEGATLTLAAVKREQRGSVRPGQVNLDAPYGN